MNSVIVPSVLYCCDAVSGLYKACARNERPGLTWSNAGLFWPVRQVNFKLSW